MKNSFAIVFIISFVLIACREEESALQKIDQKIHLYIDSATIDMLNPNDSMSYQSISFIDVYAETENSSVNFVSGMDNNAIYFREYTAGATRIAIDTNDPLAELYESKIALKLNFKSNDVVVSTYDTLKLRYKLEPDLFQVYRAWYNNEEITMEEANEAHQIKIYK